MRVKKPNKQKKQNSAWTSDGHGESLTEPAEGVREQGDIRVCQMWQTWRRHTENNGQRENMGKEMKGQRWRRTCFFFLFTRHLCYSGYDGRENSPLLFISYLVGLFYMHFPSWNQEKKNPPPVKAQMISSNTQSFDGGRYTYAILFI